MNVEIVVFFKSRTNAPHEMCKLGIKSLSFSSSVLSSSGFGGEKTMKETIVEGLDERTSLADRLLGLEIHGSI